MLLMGYDSFGEEQKAVWRKIMRYYGAEVVLTYDPARVTHVIVDWMLDEAEVVKQVRDINKYKTISNDLPSVRSMRSNFFVSITVSGHVY